MAEFKKHIPEYPGYIASDKGKIYSTHIRKRGDGELTPYVKDGILWIRIIINKKVHREHLAALIIRTFTGRTPKTTEEIIYRNGNKLDCRLENITIVPRVEMDAIRSRHHKLFDKYLITQKKSEIKVKKQVKKGEVKIDFKT
ncbi:MAG: HNH endonuclease [Candidatus Odinarchaeia archaeon]